MNSISLFAEDFGHEKFLVALVRRIAEMYQVGVKTTAYSVRGGHSKVLSELKEYLRDVNRSRVERPDLLIVGRDANCKGYNEATGQIRRVLDESGLGLSAIFAVPDPHIERWMLVDSSAFKAVFGKGCQAPDQKCEKDQYKRLLREAINAVGINPALGGMEYAEDIVGNLDLTKRNDHSLGSLIDRLKTEFNRWSDIATGGQTE